MFLISISCFLVLQMQQDRNVSRYTSSISHTTNKIYTFCYTYKVITLAKETLCHITYELIHTFKKIRARVGKFIPTRHY